MGESSPTVIYREKVKERKGRSNCAWRSRVSDVMEWEVANNLYVQRIYLMLRDCKPFYREKTMDEDATHHNKE
jgi:hypothetical protein